jgi:hypothetical protein
LYILTRKFFFPRTDLHCLYRDFVRDPFQKAEPPEHKKEGQQGKEEEYHHTISKNFSQFIDLTCIENREQVVITGDNDNQDGKQG